MPRVLDDFALEDAHFGDVDFEACAGARDEVDDLLCEHAFVGGELVDLGVGG